MTGATGLRDFIEQPRSVAREVNGSSGTAAHFLMGYFLNSAAAALRIFFTPPPGLLSMFSVATPAQMDLFVRLSIKLTASVPSRLYLPEVASGTSTKFVVVAGRNKSSA